MDRAKSASHGPAEMGCLPPTTSMVDMRATLEKALTDGVISHKLHDAFHPRRKNYFLPGSHMRMRVLQDFRGVRWLHATRHSLAV